MATQRYENLEKIDYDQDKARELAQVANEIRTLEIRLGYLKQLAHRHEDLSPYLWRDQTGKVTAICDLEDDHLKNIVVYQQKNRGIVSSNIANEYLRRFGELPAGIKTLEYNGSRDQYEGDDPFYDEMD